MPVLLGDSNQNGRKGQLIKQKKAHAKKPKKLANLQNNTIFIQSINKNE